MAMAMFESMGHGNIQPMLHLRKKGEPDVIGMLGGVPTGMVYEGVQYALSQVPYVPESIVLISDSYYLFKPDQEYLDSVKNGTNQPLEAMFKLGDLRVQEACNVTFLCSEAVISIVQAYKWTPVDGWEWGEQVVLDSREQSEVADWEFDRLIGGLPRRDISGLLEG